MVRRTRRRRILLVMGIDEQAWVLYLPTPTYNHSTVIMTKDSYSVVSYRRIQF